MLFFVQCCSWGNIKTLGNHNGISSMENTWTKRSMASWMRFSNCLLVSTLCAKREEYYSKRLLQEIGCGSCTIAHIFYLANPSLCHSKFCIKEMSFPCKLHAFVIQGVFWCLSRTKWLECMCNNQKSKHHHGKWRNREGKWDEPPIFCGLLSARGHNCLWHKSCWAPKHHSC